MASLLEGIVASVDYLLSVVFLQSHLSNNILSSFDILDLKSYLVHQRRPTARLLETDPSTNTIQILERATQKFIALVSVAPDKH